MLENENRFETLRWELVCLANKVIVADGLDLSSLDVRHRALRKTLGYINIGLELGAEGDPEKGAALLDKIWIQSFFQVGYQQLRQVRSAARTSSMKMVHILSILFHRETRKGWGLWFFGFRKLLKYSGIPSIGGIRNVLKISRLSMTL
jgi:hypothetical protein